MNLFAASPTCTVAIQGLGWGCYRPGLESLDRQEQSMKQVDYANGDMFHSEERSCLYFHSFCVVSHVQKKDTFSLNSKVRKGCRYVCLDKPQKANISLAAPKPWNPVKSLNLRLLMQLQGTCQSRSDSPLRRNARRRRREKPGKEGSYELRLGLLRFGVFARSTTLDFAAFGKGHRVES